MKTGGLVVWRNKDFLAVYRGCNYREGSNSFSDMRHYHSIGYKKNASYTTSDQNAAPVNESDLDDKLSGSGCQWENLHTTSLYEREADRLLDGLGPRFVDWWMQKPLPVDADLLPETIPGFKTPFRLCPPFTKAKLTDSELTYLRKLAHPLPTHFVLGMFLFSYSVDLRSTNDFDLNFCLMGFSMTENKFKIVLQVLK